MDNDGRKPQWAMHVIVWHGPSFGHSITIETQTQGRPPFEHPAGTWKDLGVPEPVLTAARCALDAIFTQHLTTRYGIANELDLWWGDEPEPF